MNTANLNAVAALNRRYLLDFPYEAARQLESMSPDDGAELLASQPLHAVVRAWQVLGPDVANANAVSPSLTPRWRTSCANCCAIRKIPQDV